jgi:RNA polymerase sigma-70 factor, ECF subfamily
MVVQSTAETIIRMNVRDALCEGSEVAFRQFIDEYQNSLQRFVFGMIRVSSITEEIAHDSFVELWMKYILRKRLINNPEALLYRIAHNKCVDYIRREKAWQMLLRRAPKPAPKPTPLSTFSQNEHDRILLEALNQLRTKDREIILLFYEEDMQMATIAEILGMNQEAVSSRLRRAREALREMIPPSFLEEWRQNHEE